MPRLTTAISSRVVRPCSPAASSSPSTAVDPLARRERLLDEEVLDPAVLAAAQQHDVGVLDAAPGAADLLVVGDDRAGRLVVHDERQVGLVVAHPERAGGDDGLDLVAQQPLLGGDPLVGLLLAAVGQRRDPVGASGTPRPARRRAWSACRRSPSPAAPAGARPATPAAAPGAAARAPPAAGSSAPAGRGRSAAARRPRAASCSTTSRDDAIVGGRGRAEHRDVRARARRACPSRAGSRDGSRGPSRRCSAPRRSPAARPTRRTAAASRSRKLRVVQPLGADQQQVDRVRARAARGPRPTPRGWCC